MIIPQPESDLSLNTLVLGARIIEILKKNGEEYIIVEKLLKNFLKKDSKKTPKMFFDTLTYLFILGLIEEDNYKVRLKYGHTQKNLF